MEVELGIFKLAYALYYIKIKKWSDNKNTTYKVVLC